MAKKKKAAMKKKSKNGWRYMMVKKIKKVAKALKKASG